MELAADPLRHRFTLVFDREGYSPGLFQRLKARRVACLSYRKYPGDDWSAEGFVDATVSLHSCEQVRMRQARSLLRAILNAHQNGPIFAREN